MIGCKLSVCGIQKKKIYMIGFLDDRIHFIVKGYFIPQNRTPFQYAGYMDNWMQYIFC